MAYQQTHTNMVTVPVSLQSASSSSVASATSPCQQSEIAGKSSQESGLQENSYNITILQRMAWRSGRRAATNPATMGNYVREVKDAIHDYSSRHALATEMRGEIWKHYREGLQDARIPRDAPEKALEAVKWYQQNVIREFGKTDGYRYITKSKKFIFLIFIAYYLGICYGTFPFAQHRITMVAKNLFPKFSTGTVYSFIKWAIKRGLLEIVREGSPHRRICARGQTDNNIAGGTSATYRLAGTETIVKAFGMDRSILNSDTYVNYVEREHRRIESSTLHAHQIDTATQLIHL